MLRIARQGCGPRWSSHSPNISQVSKAPLPGQSRGVVKLDMTTET